MPSTFSPPLLELFLLQHNPLPHFSWLGSAWLSAPMWARAVVELLPLKVSQITVNAAFSCNAPSEFVMILLQIVAFVLNNNTVVGGTWGGEAKRWEPSMGI